jgi:L-gulonolactone oxidase
LDTIRQWNRLYGKRGFYQYQCVLPTDDAPIVIEELLKQIARAGAGSFLSVLKTFGSIKSPGLLSFPRQGATLALDFPNKGKKTLSLLGLLDDLVKEAGGRLYPAKDGRMPREMLETGYPMLEEFQQYIDPSLSSDFWRRVSA